MDYEKFRKNMEDSGTYWSSYSDLFMVLSLVFLLLYVTASLTSSTFNIQAVQKNHTLTQKIAELQQQLASFEAHADGYVRTKASVAEQRVYEKVLKKLSLLTSDAKQKKRRLRQEAREQGRKEQELNEYQKVVKSIIQSNLLARERVKIKNKVIRKKNQVIEREKKEVRRRDALIVKKQKELKNLSKKVSEHEKKIASKATMIEKIKSDLVKKIKQLNETKAVGKKEEEALKRKIDELKIKGKIQISQLESEKVRLSSALDSTKNRLEEKNREISKKNEENRRLSKKIREQLKNHQGRLKALASDLKSEQERLKSQFDREMAKLKGSAKEERRHLKELFEKRTHELSQKNHKEKVALEEKFKGEKKKLEKVLNRSAQEKQAMKGSFASQLENLNREARKREGGLKGKLASLNKSLGSSQAALKKAMRKVNARRDLAAQIGKSFKDAGIAADVNPGTGDVVLSFGKEYFNTGSAELKANMRKILEKFVPKYSEGLLANKKLSEKIETVEIIGFASPTYKGKYVDPNSLDPKNREAVDFNLDLSFDRAKSIFKYIFDTEKMKYRHQKELLSLVKVTGRSFLAEKGIDREVSSEKGHFCDQHDCKKAQKVIIKFSLKN